MRKIIPFALLLLGLIVWRALVHQPPMNVASVPTARQPNREGAPPASHGRAESLQEEPSASDGESENPSEEPPLLESSGQRKFSIVRGRGIAAPSGNHAGTASPRSALTATITTDDGVQENAPDGIGMFPEIKMKKGQKAKVRLAMEPNAHATLQVLDGGQMNDSTDALEILSDGGGFVEFEYSPLPSEGTYRIAIDDGGRKKFLYFTIG